MSQSPRAAILVTGDEVLRGRIRESNAGYLGRSLEEHGVRVERMVVIGDDMPALVGELGELLTRGVDVVCTSGGLGPTHDDLTMAAVARATGRPLLLDPGALEMVRAQSRGIRRRRVDEATVEAVQEKQAHIPEGATVLPPVGTAPGCVVEHGATTVVVLPGPPWELQGMWSAALADGPLAAALGSGGARARVVRLFAVIESEFMQALKGVDPDVLARLEVGVYTRPGELEVLVRPRGPAAEDAVAQVMDALARAFGDSLYSRDGRSVDEIVADGLRASGQTLSVAESCTGGGLGARITQPAGASAYFLGGAVVYADRLKSALLGVDPDLLARHGAVSAECARAMALGAREATGSDWALSITGIAGPDGGTPAKPVGLVYLGLAGPAGAQALEQRFRGDRERVREQAQAVALHMLRMALA